MSIVIPNSVTSIGAGAFCGCDIKMVYVGHGDAERVKALLGDELREYVSFVEVGGEGER